jgi:ABC-2 type transport system permease protein
MSTLTHTLVDSTTMLRRNLLHAKRYPSLTLIVAAIPIIFLLIFVFVLGDTLGDGLGGGGGRGDYLKYVVPGILLMGIAGGAQGTAISVAMDMTEGIIARFRTMAISRAAVLTGHVLGSLIQTMIGITVVIGVALAIGFRPNANPLEWLGTIGMLALVTFALTWVSVAMGMWCKTVEGASNLPMPLMLLPFFGSAFVPADSMPAGVSWFAAHQPFTPIIETLRGMLTGTEIGNDWIIAIGWCLVIAAIGYVWARKSYNKDHTSS